MRKHNGMRPQDVAILLKMLTLDNSEWTMHQLASATGISLSEVSESLNRSQFAGLIDHKKKQVNRQVFLEFLEFGFRYVFPVAPGPLVRGFPAGISHPFLKKKFGGEMDFVWPDPQGTIIGQELPPLYNKQTSIINSDPVFYKLLALADVIRIGKLRERNFALDHLKKTLLHEPAYK